MKLLPIIKTHSIIEFLSRRGWQKTNSDSLYHYFIPPNNLGFASSTQIQIPKIDKTKGAQQQLAILIELVASLYQNVSFSDLRLLFSKPNSIFLTRIIDSETEKGFIGINRLNSIIEYEKRLIQNAVIFVHTSKPIFGDAKEQVEDYLENTMVLPTSKGSFVTKIALPNEGIHKLSDSNTEIVSSRLLDVFEFVDREVNTVNLDKIDSSFVTQYSDLINIELLRTVNGLYRRGALHDVEFSMINESLEKTMSIIDIQKKVGKLSKFIKKTHAVILDSIQITVVGLITSLKSRNVETDGGNEVRFEAEYQNETFKFSVRLDKSSYLQAVDAHKAKMKLHISGFAKQSHSGYIFSEVTQFRVL